MRFEVDEFSMAEYNVVILNVYFSNNWISRHYLTPTKIVQEFISQYLTECKLEMLTALGVSEWWVVDGDGMPITSNFSDYSQAKETLRNIKMSGFNISQK